MYDGYPYSVSGKLTKIEVGKKKFRSPFFPLIPPHASHV